MGDFKGYISRQHTVWCGECGNWEQADEHLAKNAQIRFRRLGWRKTKEQGWLCPGCYKVWKGK